MPVVLYILAVAVFAQATSEFMLAGLVTEIAADLGVSVAVAGSLTSAFAVGMVIGAPLVALGARRFPPRTSLASFLVVFAAVHVIGALTPSFIVLVVTRVLAALANAGFLAVALTVAVRLAPPERTSRATSILLAGSTLALIVGVPAGALLGQLFGWRSTFWTVAIVTLPALVAVLLQVPSRPSTDGVLQSVQGELAVLRRLPVALTLLVAALVNGGTFAVYTYIAPLIVGTGELGPAAVPIALALFGVGSFLGVTAAARFADAHYQTLLYGVGAAVLVGWAILALIVGYGWVGVVLIGVLGGLAFTVGTAVIGRSLALAPDAPTMGGSFTTAALNVGATGGPLLGGASLALSPTGPAWVATVLVALAAVPALLSLRASVQNPSGASPSEIAST